MEPDCGLYLLFVSDLGQLRFGSARYEDLTASAVGCAGPRAPECEEQS